MPKGIPKNGINAGWFKKGVVPIHHFKKGHIPWHKGKPFMQKEKHPLWGKHHSKEAKLKMRIAKLGKKQSEEHKQKISDAHKNKHWGKNNCAWKGGITPLRGMIYNLEEYEKWKQAIFKRDNYICQICGRKRKVGDRVELNVHHLKSFSIILNEFLKEYSQFSAIEDKETLLRLAITYQPFWDIENGQTLCEECHSKTPNYGKNIRYGLVA